MKIGLAKLRRNFARVRIAVQQGQSCVVTYHGTPILRIVNASELTLPGSFKIREMAVSDFRNRMNAFYEKLIARELDAVIVFVYGKPKIAIIREEGSDGR